MLNNEQKLIVKNVEGPIRVLAGPGSGKTRTIVQRIANLIKQKVSPKDILAITFTNKAAIEMKTRINAIVANEKEKVFVSTFHSFCAKLIRRNHEYIEDFKHNYIILDETDKKSLIKKIVRELELDELELPVKDIISFISFTKNKGEKNKIKEGSSDFDKHKFQIYDKYIEYQKQNNSLDFDDLVVKAIEILQNNANVKKYYNDRFKYIHIDEFQDTNFIQYKLIKLLVNKSNNICVVGDPDQNIYSWRGSKIEIILNFDQDFPETKTFYLTQNYRSTKNILSIANDFINKDKTDSERVLFTKNPKGDQVDYYQGYVEDDEAAWITSQILILAEKGVQLKEITILYRLSFLSRSIEQALMNAGIKFKVYGGPRFYERKEIKIALAYLRFSIQKDDISFEKIISSPKRGIGEQKKNEIKNVASKYGVSLWMAITLYQKECDFSPKQLEAVKDFIQLFENSPSDDDKNFYKGFRELLTVSKYWSTLSKNTLNISKIENLKELMNSIELQCKNNPHLTAGKYLSDIALDWVNENDSDNAISLMTIHKAKGIENNHIFIMGLSEGILPTNQAKTIEEIEEERRIFYVAITRAINNLYLSYSRQKGASRFLQGINPKYLKQGTWQAKELTLEDKIKHNVFGEGIVIKVDDETIEVDFGGEFGIKTLMKNHKSIKRI